MIDRVKDDVRLSVSFASAKPAGALAAGAWLSARGLQAPASGLWEVGITFEDEDTMLHIAITSQEWGFVFGRQKQASWIRVMDIPFVHERDDFKLLGSVPPLRDLGKLVQTLEDRCEMSFARKNAIIRTTIPDSEPVIRIWVAAAL